MKKIKWSDVACVACVLVVEALSILCVVESGDPDLPLWAQRLMRWTGFFCIIAYTFTAGSVWEARRYEEEFNEEDNDE